MASRGRTPAPGRVALGRADGAGRHFVGERPIVAGFELGGEPWDLAGVVCAGVVLDDATHAAALDVAMRGADVVAEVSSGRLAAFLDDVGRAGITLWAGNESGEPDWIPLLDALAAGGSVAEAARACHLSLRTAHRRLERARADLHAPTTAAAIATWSARRSAG